MAAKDAGMIDVHFHLIPQFYRDAVYEAGRGPAIGRYPDWSPQLALELMDTHGIALAITSLAQPGVGFVPAEQAAGFARRCNEYAAELIAQHPGRFGCFALLPMHDMEAAIAEARACGAKAIAVTFNPHPETVLRPAQASACPSRRRPCRASCRSARMRESRKNPDIDC